MAVTDTGLYSFEGVAVDIKADNKHISARPASGTLNADNTTATDQIGVGTIVIIDSSGRLNNATQAAETQAVGIATETRDADDARPCTVTYFGVVRVMASAAIALGAALRVANGGKVVTGTLGTNRIIGRALQAAGADGDIIEALVNFTQ